MAEQTHEHKLKLIFEPDMGPANKAVDALQKRLDDLSRRAAAGLPQIPGTPARPPSAPAGAGGGAPAARPNAAAPAPAQGRPPSLATGAAFSGATQQARITGQQLAQSFIDVLRGRTSPLTQIASALQQTVGGGRFRHWLFGQPMPEGLTGVDAMTHRLRHTGVVPRFGAWLGRGVGGVGPGGGALLGGTAVAAGGAMVIGAAISAARQFVEGVRLYVAASARLAAAVTGADPAQLILAGTQAREAAARMAILRYAGRGAAAGGIIGAGIGGVATGGPGALIGGSVGAGLGAIGGVVVGSVKAWIAKIELQIQERLFAALDGLMRGLENYNGIIFGLARQFELQQNMFLFRLGREAVGLANAWFSLKMATLDFMRALIDAGIIKSVFDAIGAYLKQLQSQLPQIVAGLLDGMADVIDGLAALKAALEGMVAWVKRNFPATIAITKAATTGDTSGAKASGMPWTVGIVGAFHDAYEHGQSRRTIGGYVGGATGTRASTAATERAIAAAAGGAATSATTQAAQHAATAAGAGLSGFIRGLADKIRNMPPPKVSAEATMNEWQNLAGHFARLAFPQGGADARGQGGGATIAAAAALAGAQMRRGAAAGRRTTEGAGPYHGKPSSDIGAIWGPHAQAAAAAAQAAKAPVQPFPQFNQNISLEFKAKLWHERAIYDSMAQVRDRLLQEMDTVKNESRLSIALLDTRSQAMAF